MLTLCGCSGDGSAKAASSESTSAQKSKPLVFEAGIVFSDRDGYFCLSLEQIGLSASDEIASVVSSCDCVQSTVVSYVSASGNPSQAVLLTYRKETGDKHDLAAGKSPEPTANLGVLVEAKTNHDSEHQSTVNLLHTSPLQDSTPWTADEIVQQYSLGKSL